MFRDYDPGIHLNQLQMQAGVVGWNAIRVYNPAKQLADWDAGCRFVRRWVPELKTLPAERIVSGDDLPGFPPPVVPFTERVKQMTDALYAIRRSAAAKAATAAVYLRHGSRKQERTVRLRKVKKPAKPSTPSLFDDA